ncbi:hypothetical protein DESC_120035 [Desulfosarcina cetonica]|nr:hypothetical protein DESC_120035 [Desulfosarcina cetonica]
MDQVADGESQTGALLAGGILKAIEPETGPGASVGSQMMQVDAKFGAVFGFHARISIQLNAEQLLLTGSAADRLTAHVHQAKLVGYHGGGL